MKWMLGQRWHYSKRCVCECVNVCGGEEETDNGNGTSCVFLWRFYVWVLISSQQATLNTGLLHTITEFEVRHNCKEPGKKVKIAFNRFEWRWIARNPVFSLLCLLTLVSARIRTLTKTVPSYHVLRVRRNLLQPAGVQQLWSLTWLYFASCLNHSHPVLVLFLAEISFVLFS